MTALPAKHQLREALLRFQNAQFLYVSDSGDVWKLREVREESSQQLVSAVKAVLDLDSAESEMADAMKEALDSMPGTTSSECSCLLFHARGMCWHLRGKRALDKLTSKGTTP